jgi:hypothetical protein
LDLAARIGLGVLTPLVIVGALFADAPVRDPFHAAAPLANSASLPDLSNGSNGANRADRASQQDEKRDGSAIDLYGNDVSDAVAKYKLDATGSLYELHSPQTELPRLGSPKS